MKSIADFKKKMIIGAKVNSTLYHTKNGVESLITEQNNRTCTVSQSNSFALTVPDRFDANGKPISSWCDWPKSKAFKVINDNTVEISFSFGRLTYEFI